VNRLQSKIIVNKKSISGVFAAFSLLTFSLNAAELPLAGTWQMQLDRKR
jgi:hypothetical protein